MLCSICKTYKKDEKLFKCNKCPNLFHQKCIKKWLKIHTDSDIIYYCTKCSFIGFNDKDLSYQPLLETIHEETNERYCCCNIC